jgi:hypothetical protein
MSGLLPLLVAQRGNRHTRSFESLREPGVVHLRTDDRGL